MIDDEFLEPHMYKFTNGFASDDRSVLWYQNRVNELTDLLREIQFCDKNYFDFSDCCPVCGGDEEDGHKPDCRLNNLLTSK